jgi:hypothetical protein
MIQKNAYDRQMFLQYCPVLDWLCPYHLKRKGRMYLDVAMHVAVKAQRIFFGFIVFDQCLVILGFCWCYWETSYSFHFESDILIFSNSPVVCFLSIILGPLFWSLQNFHFSVYKFRARNWTFYFFRCVSLP